MELTPEQEAEIRKRMYALITELMDKFHVGRQDVEDVMVEELINTV